jgi:hypothetical protein
MPYCVYVVKKLISFKLMLLALQKNIDDKVKCKHQQNCNPS